MSARASHRKRLRKTHHSSAPDVGNPLSDDSLLVSLSTSVSRHVLKCCSASACSGRQSVVIGKNKRVSRFARLRAGKQGDAQTRAMASSTETHSLLRPLSGHSGFISETWSG